ncbi:hypothetical protein [Magnetococcus marinus]|uniref:hypothetical protein n=1 Tax=Magnetococcus marinus TaxID=1124597 RepID=UPI0000381A2D|nr:hypothetical protein [Magnetococcus marinus]
MVSLFKKVFPELVHEAESLLIRRIAYDLDGNPEYIGQANPGALDTDEAWFVRRIAYEGGNPVSILFAEGSTKFNKRWDLRGSYDYR